MTSSKKRLLSKLTMENFDRVSEKICDNVGRASTVECIATIANYIQSKAIMEISFSRIYALLVLKIIEVPLSNIPQSTDQKVNIATPFCSCLYRRSVFGGAS
jgi:hypothetical protein